MTISAEKTTKKSPRERILTAACELFYKHGIRAVGVEAIADATSTNKMTLYRHFASKDELVAEYLRRLAGAADRLWTDLEAAHPGDARAQLRAWLETMGKAVTSGKARGCALANAAIELPERHHPARCVIEQHKKEHRDRLVRLCRSAGLDEPDMLADELFLLLEGARVSAQSVGPQGPSSRLARMGEALIASHTLQPAR